MDQTETKQKDIKLPWYIKNAKIIICGYLAFVALYTVIFVFSKGENFLLPSNELGDFLAGIFAPLAFYMLAVGYYQNTQALKLQLQELQLNTSALNLQAEELKNSVEQQKELVETTKTELDMLSLQHQENQLNYFKQQKQQIIRDEMNSLPVIQFGHLSLSNYSVINIGSPVINVIFIKIDNLHYISSYIAVLKSTSAVTADETIHITPMTHKKNFTFKILFTTSQGVRYEQTFSRYQLENDSTENVIFSDGPAKKIDIVDY